MRNQRSQLLTIFDLVEAFQICHAVTTLHDLKMFVALKQQATAESLASKRGFDPVLLRGILDYIAARTSLLQKKGRYFKLAGDYSRHSRFLLDLYAGAYRRNATHLHKLMPMQGRTHAAGLVDRVRLARAFSECGGGDQNWVADIIRQLRFNHVLELGCGPASLLVQLAVEDLAFYGCGLDHNPAMCKLARGAIRAAAVSDRVKLIRGDAGDLAKSFPACESSDIQAILACQVTNGMFGAGDLTILNWLRQIRKVFPGRYLMIVDYYGRLGHTTYGQHRETLLHDYAQLVSGQGVPPADNQSWRKIYARAGCRLLHLIEDQHTTRFMHILMLK